MNAIKSEEKVRARALFSEDLKMEVEVEVEVEVEP